jgi:hypothetical protein
MSLKNKIAAGFSLVLFFACVDIQRIEINHPEPEKALVIKSLIQPYTGPYNLPDEVSAELATLRSINDSYDTDTIKDADIFLKQGNSIIDTLVFDTIQNKYTSQLNISTLTDYCLEVYYDDFPPLHAIESIPQFVKPDSVIINPLARVDDLGGALGEVTVYFSDPPDVQNFYEVQIATGRTNTYIFSEDPVITNEFYYPKNIKLHAFNPKRLLFSDHSLNSKQKKLTFSFYQGGASSWNNEGSSSKKINAGYVSVYFRSVSPGYYNYFASYLDYKFNMSSDIIFGSREPVNIISNIENGYGFFGAYQESLTEVYFYEIKY